MLTKEQLTEKSLNELREIAKDLKANVTNNTKAGNISAILEVQTTNEIATLDTTEVSKDTILLNVNGVISSRKLVDEKTTIGNFIQAINFVKSDSKDVILVTFSNGKTFDALTFVKKFKRAIGNYFLANVMTTNQDAKAIAHILTAKVLQNEINVNSLQDALNLANIDKFVKTLDVAQLASDAGLKIDVKLLGY